MSIFGRTSISLDRTYQDTLNNLDQAYNNITDNFNGYVDAFVSLDGDGDTYNITLAGSNESFQGRLGANSAGRYVDTPEKSMYDTFGNHIGSNPYKTEQMRFLSRQTGKDITELTDQDFNNYNNYVLGEVGNILTNNSSSNTYNSTQVYENPYKGQSIPVKVRVGDQASATDSRVIVDFKVGDSNLSEIIYNDTRLNSTGRYGVELSDSYMNAEEQGFVENLINTAQSAGYRYGSKVVDWGLSEEQMKNTKLFGQSLYDIAYTEGVSENLAGVSQKNYKEFQSEMTKASEDWEKGNYGSWLKTIIVNSPTIMAQSAPEMTVSAVAAIATGGSSLATQALGMGSAMLLNASTYTAQAMEDYKKNNNGQEMPGEIVAMSLAANMLASGMDILTFKGVASYIPSLNKFVNKVDDLVAQQGIKGFVSNFGNATATGAIGEWVQEGMESANSIYFSQDQSNKKSYLEVATSPEVIEGAFTGAVVGGVMAGGGTVASAPLDLASSVVDKASKPLQETTQQLKDVQTNSGVNPEQVKTFQDAYAQIDSTEINYMDGNEVNKVLSTLASFSSDSLDSTNADKRYNKIKEVVSKATEMGTHVPKEYSKMVQEVEEEVILGNLPKNIQSLTPKQLEKTIEQVAKDTESTKEEVQLAIMRKGSEEVTQEVRYGTSGYLSYGARIDELSSALMSKTLPASKREGIETSIDRYAESTKRLYTNQLNKAKAFLEGVKEQAKTKEDQVVSYGDSEFTMNYEYMVGKYQDKGAFAIIPTLLQDIKDMEGILEMTDRKITTEESLDLASYIDEFELAIREMGSNYSADSIRNIFESRGNLESTQSTPAIEQNTPKIESKKESDTKVQEEPKEVKSTPRKDSNKEKTTKVAEEPTADFDSFYYTEDQFETEFYMEDFTEESPNELVIEPPVVFEESTYTDIDTLDEIGQEEFRRYSSPTTISMSKTLANRVEAIDKGVVTDEDYNIINTYPTKIAEVKQQITNLYNKLSLDRLARKKQLDNIDMDMSTEYVNLNNIYSQIKNLIPLKKEANKVLAELEKSRDAIRIEAGRKEVLADIQDAKHSQKLSKENAIKLEQAEKALDKALKALAVKQKQANLQEDFIAEITNSIKTLSKIGRDKRITIEQKKQTNKLLKQSFIDSTLESKLDIGDLQTELVSLQNALKESKAKVKDVDTRIPAIGSSILLDTLHFTNDADLDKFIDNPAKKILVSEALKPSKDANNLLAVHSIKKDMNIAGVTLDFIKKTIRNSLYKIEAENRHGVQLSKKEVLLEEISRGSALGLLYDSSNVTDKTDIPMNDNVATAIYYSIVETLSQGNYIFTPGIDSFDSLVLRDSEGNELSDQLKVKFIEQFGVFRSTVARDIGQTIMKTLGLSANFNGDNYNRGDYEAIETNIGNLAITVMESMGLLESYNYKQINESFQGAKLDTLASTVKLKTGNFSKWDKQYKDLSEVFVIDKTKENTRIPQKVQPAKLTKATAKDKSIELAQEYVDVLNIENSTQWTVDRKSIKSLFYKEDGTRNTEVINSLLTKAGYEWNLDSLPLDAYISATGFSERITKDSLKDYDIDISNMSEEEITQAIKDVEHGSTVGSNGTLKKEVDDLLNLYEEDYNGPYFFNHFISNVGRNFKISSTVNPQTGKHFARTLMQAGNTVQTISKTNKESMFRFKFALASAFDHVKSNKDIDKLGNDLLSGKIPLQDLKDALVSPDKSAFKKVDSRLGVETVGHVILAINAIEAYQNSKGSDTFTHNLTSEHDATTSGYFHRFMQYANQPKVMLEKVGLFTAKGKLKLAMHEYKVKGNDDIYQTTMRKYSPFFPYLKKEKGIPSMEVGYINEATLKNLGVEYAKPTSESINTFLDKLVKGELRDAILDTPTEEISSELRSYAKPATMTSAYGSGVHSTTRGVGNTVLEKYIGNFYSLLQSTSDKDLYTTFNSENMSKENLAFKNFMVKLAFMAEEFTINDGYNISNKLKNPKTAEAYALMFWKTKLKSNSLSDIKIALPKFKEVFVGKDKKAEINTSLEHMVKWKNSKAKVPGYITLSTEQILSDIFGQTVGMGVQKAINTLYEQDKDISNNFNNMYGALGFIYSKMVENVRTKLAEDNNGVIPNKLYEAELKRLEPFKPLVRSALTPVNAPNSQKFPILDDTPALDNRIDYNNVNSKTGEKEPVNVTQTIRKAKGGYATTTSSIRNPAQANIKGMVVAIQSIDGAILAKTIKALRDNNNLSIGAIHDAINIPAESMDTAVYEFNKQSYEVNKDYSMFEQLEQHLIALDKYLADNPDLLEQFESLQYSTTGLSTFNGESMTDLSFMDVLSRFRSTLAFVDVGRKTLLDKDNISVANIGGLANYVPNKKVEYSEEAKEVLGSSPYITSSTDKKEYFNTVLTDTEARLEVFDKLLENNKSDSKEHIKEIRGLLENFNDNLFTELQVTLNEVKERIGTGQFHPDNKTIIIDTPKSARVSQTLQSDASNFVHETIHAITYSVLKNPTLYTANKMLGQVSKLYLEAHSKLDYTAFLRDKDTATELDIDIAKKMWKYIFNPENSTQGMAEFMAYAITNESFKNNLKAIRSYGKSDKLSFIERVVNLVSDLVDIFRGKKAISQVFPAFVGVMSGKVDTRDVNKDMYESVLALTDRLASVNSKYIKKLGNNKDSILVDAYIFMKELLDTGNVKLSGVVNKLINRSDAELIEYNVKHTDSTAKKLMGITKAIVFMMGRILTSSKARNSLSGFLSSTGLFRGWGFVQTFLRDVSINTDHGRLFDSLAAQVDNIEGASQRIVNDTYVALRDAFGEDLTNEQSSVLTRVGLATDLSSLLDNGFSFQEIKALLTDEQTLTQKIKDTELSMRSHVADRFKKMASNYTNLMAHYLVTKEGFEDLPPNASVLAEMVRAKNASKDIDSLVTLKALKMLSKEDLDMFNNLGDKGLEVFLTTHSNFKKDSVATGGVQPEAMLKGWYKTIPSENKQTRYDLTSNESELAKQGYIKVLDLAEGISYYKHSYLTHQTRDGAAFTSKGAFSFGTAIQEFSNSTISYKLTKQAKGDSALAKINNKAGLKSKHLRELLFSKPNVTYKDIKEYTSGLVPIMVKETYMPNAGYSNKWYSASLTNAQRLEILGPEENGLNVLSKMMGSHSLWAQSEEVNQTMLNFLVNDMKDNFQLQSIPAKYADGLLGINGKKFLAIAKENVDPYIVQHYGALPLAVRQYVEDGNPLYIREDYINQVFGVPSYTLAQLNAFNKAPNNLKKTIAFLEAVMKEIAGHVKNSIVVGLPVVVFENIVGNLATTLYYGISPLRAMRVTLKAFRNTKDYVRDRKEMGVLEAKKKVGLLTDKEVEKIALLKNKMENNPVHELFQEGLYQSIVEDLKETNYPLTSKGVQWVEGKIKRALPKPLVEVFRQAYMLEGTPIYDTLFEIVQYSDFAARAAQYEVLMDKAPKDKVDNIKFRQNVIADIRDMYINYNKPNSKFEQYLDDLGLIMFIKYAKRVNSVILGIFKDRPLSAIIATLSQMYIIDTPDMLESNGITRNWMNNFHTPVENITTTLSPRLYEAAMDIWQP